jgi:hypothetical protein
MQDIFASITEQLVSFRATEIAVIGGRGFLAMLAVSLAASLFISALYLIFYQNRATGSQINRAFPLLGIAITTLFVSIQFSLPLSLGLLGALSIVRFRTPIKEPEEIGFLMLVIASSIAIATANFKFMMILLAAAVAALLFLRYGPRVLKDTLTEGYLSVSFNNDRYAEAGDAVKTMVADKLRYSRLHSITRTGDATTIAFSFDRINRGELAEIEASLVSNAALSDYNIFLNRDATL